MSLFARLELVRRIVELADTAGYDRYPDAMIHMNGWLLKDAYEARKLASMPIDAQGGYANQARLQQQGEPVRPKGKWIATVATYSGDDDDPERAVAKLERKVSDAVLAFMDHMVTERTKKLDEARELATKLRDLAGQTGSVDK